MLPAVSVTGRTFGGAGNAATHSPEDVIYIPEMYYCQYLLPRDILMCHWLYDFGLQTDFVHHTQGYEMVFGNMAAASIVHWRDRRRFGAKGGYCSNWGSYHPEYMQRNNQYFELIFGAYALWSEKYDNPQRLEVIEKTFREAFRLHYGSVDEGNYILVTHNTDRKHSYHTFVDGLFIEDAVYHLGRYKLTYTDGTEVYFDVKYGTNISNEDIPCELGEQPENFDPEGSLSSIALGEVAYSALPRTVNGKTRYTTAYKNPHPEKTVKSFEYISESDAKVNLFEVRF